MKAIEVKVSYYMGFGHSVGRYSERTRTKQVADKVTEQLQSLLDAKKAAKKKPLELTHGEKSNRLLRMAQMSCCLCIMICLKAKHPPTM
jgi:hypothetical protein